MSKKIEATNVQVTEVLGQIKSVLEKESNSTKDILDFFEKENEWARQHELELFKIMFQTPLNAQYHIPFNKQSTQPPLNTQNHPPTDVQPIQPETQRNMLSLNCNGQLPLSSYRSSSIATNSAMNNNAFQVHGLQQTYPVSTNVSNSVSYSNFVNQSFTQLLNSSLDTSGLQQ